MSNTYQVLINWDKGHAMSERMSAKILSVEEYKNIDPQNPTGGPDRAKDILALKNNKKYVIGCYFPNGQKSFSNIKNKFNTDLKGVTKNKASGLIFVTNQKITPMQRLELAKTKVEEIEIYHLERICNILDSPNGYGIRLEYLGIELSKEEQLSFLNSVLNLKEKLRNIENTISKNKAVNHTTICALPISGVKFSSRISMEDLLYLHQTILQTEISKHNNFLGFRKLDVFVLDNRGERQAVFAPPKNVLQEIFNLLDWWRKEYMKIIYDSEDKKISTIAKFHEKFLTIHPFLDGNGRVARAIASIQYKDLLEKDVEFSSVKNSNYYEALQSAQNGSRQELNNIFKALIK